MTSRPPNRELRGLVAETGLTYAAVARTVRAVAAECGEALRTNKSTVEHWISGAAPQGNTGHYLREALSRHLGRLLTPAELGLADACSPAGEDDTIGLTLQADPLDVLLPLWRCELDRRRVLAASAYSVAAAALPLSQARDITARTAAARTGRVAGMAEVDAVRAMIQIFTDLDERHGGQHGRSALVAYLRDDVAALCRGSFRTDAIRQQMLSAASRGVHLLGWKSYDAGQQGLAQRYYLQSYTLARESEITGHDGFVLRTMAMQGLKLHRPEHCLDLAETGLRRAAGHVDPYTEALFRVVHAHTLARAGQHHRAATEADHARTLISTAPADDLPYWALTWGPPVASVYSRLAKVNHTLGDHRAAAEQHARAARSRPAATYARIAALDLMDSAELHLTSGHSERACATWHRALDHLDGVTSARTAHAVAALRRHLCPLRARGLRAATELDTRARDVLATTARTTT